MLSLPLGPIIGGWLLEHFWWGWIFLINVPVVIVTIIAIAIRLPKSERSATTHIDVFGSSAFSIGLVCTTYGIIQAGVLHDEYDRWIVEALEAQPPELGPIEALRNAVRETVAGMSEDDLLVERARNQLISSFYSAENSDVNIPSWRFGWKAPVRQAVGGRLCETSRSYGPWANTRDEYGSQFLRPGHPEGHGRMESRDAKLRSPMYPSGRMTMVVPSTAS
uniref:hypothetical protein n=1 Tax=Alicyclobacillus acidiphilus TaxID=182455 RepID=UPI0012ED38CE